MSELNLSEEYDSQMINESPDACYENVNSIPAPRELEDKYIFIRMLGTGTHSHVFEAVRKSDSRHVAIKRLWINSVTTWKEYDLFQREADVLSKLDISGVVDFYEAVECLDSDDPAAYIVQEYVDGRSLDQMIKDGYRFKTGQVFQLGIRIIDILEQLHNHQPCIIHRDIKPSNIILKQSGADIFEPVLIDFGAVSNPQVQTGGSTVAGTYGYMPPEQLVGRPCPASDIYALGATLVYMLCGVEPSEMPVSDFRLVFDPFLENIPAAVVQVLHQMLEPRVIDRLCDDKQLRTIFSRFASGQYELAEINGLSNININALDKYNIFWKIESLKQYGNLDIWTQLPDAAPRQIPESLLNEIERALSWVKPWPSREWRVSWSGSRRYSMQDGEEHENVWFRIKSALSVFFCEGGKYLHFVCAAVLLPGMFAGKNVWMIICIVCLSTLFVYWSVYAVLTANSVNLRTLRSRGMDVRAGISLDCVRVDSDEAEFELQRILILLKHGRKAMASVVDCQAVENEPACVERKTVASAFQLESAAIPCTMLNEVHYVVRYRFVIMDGDIQQEYIHEVTMRKVIDALPLPGEPIPILYMHTACNESCDCVMSMPFPFPLRYIHNFHEAYCREYIKYG